MTSRSISVRVDIYQKLASLKKASESFSDVIENLLDGGVKGSFSRLMKYFGVRADFADEFPDLRGTRDELDQSIDERINARDAGES